MPPQERHHPRNTITTELPMDIIIYKILPMLPAKYLLLCRCVSKQWHSFLKTPLFNQMHLHHLTNDNHHKLLVFSTETPWMFYTIDCESPKDGLTPGRPLPFELASGGKVLTSFGGLVCVGIFKNKYYDRQYSDMILWNPLTRDYKRLTKAESHKECYKRGNVYGLYYTSCDDDYKLLCITPSHKAYIYSLKCDAWRKIDFGEHLKRVSLAYDRWSPCTLVNEKIYFLNCSNYNYREPFDRVTHSIISFDTKTEKFSVIATPILGNRYVRCLSHRGCLYLYVVTPERTVELWSLMNGDRDWTKVVTYPLNMFTCHPMHLMKDGNWLTEDDGSVFRVDLGGRIKDKLWSYDRHSMRIHTRDRYIETLVSPNR